MNVFGNEVNLRVYRGYRLTVYNVCHSGAGYWPERDWHLTYIGTNVLDIVNRFWDEYPDNDVVIDGVRLAEVLYTLHKGIPVVLEVLDASPSLPIDFYARRAEAQEKRDQKLNTERARREHFEKEARLVL